jgi:secreted trypsin-like serine protease
VTQRLPTSIRRLTSLVPAVAGLIACVLALQAPSAGAARLNEDPLVPYIVGGQESSISQFPWQVFVLRYDKVEGTETACGGSILDATHILTAAHCVDHAGNTTTYPAGEVEVLAGASNVSGFSSSFIAPTGSQVRVSSRIRTDPYYTVLPEIKDDVAVLELSAPLELSAAANAEPIALVATGATPAPGTVLSLSGYGKQDGAENAQPNGGLYSTTLTAISSDACRGAVGVNSAVLLCALSASSSG